MRPVPFKRKVANNQLLNVSRNLAAVENTVSRPVAGMRVLVADQDAKTGDLLRSLNDRGGYRIVSVSDGREAFRILRSDADFQVAIFNMTIQHLHGVDIVRYMKSEKRLMRIPVVLLSGEGDTKIVAESFAAGAMALLSKPFTVEQLHRTIRLAINVTGRVEVRCAA